MRWLVLVVLTGFVASTVCKQQVLVLVEDLSTASTHSIFLQQLEKAGYLLDVKGAQDKSLRLREWDSWLYSKLVIFASGISGEIPL